MTNGDMPFPVWMSAVQDRMCEISDRMTLAGFSPPPIPTPLGGAYAIYGGIDPAIAAVMIMKDAIDLQRRMQGP